jgi:hypothetical protein
VKPTQALTERALNSILRLLSKCDPEHQPEAQMLEALNKLLDRHGSGTPAADYDKQLKEMRDSINRVETMAGIVGRGVKR